MQKCSKCEKTIPENIRFCPYCGIPLIEGNNESEASKITDVILIQSKIKELSSIIKHIFDTYFPIYGVEIVFQIHLCSKGGREVFLSFTKQNGSQKYKIYVDQGEVKDNYNFLKDFIITAGFDFIKEGYKIYDYDSEKKAEEEYGDRMKSIYLATLINGGVNDCIEREGKKIISEINEKSFKYNHVYCKYIKEQSEAFDYLLEILKEITENTEYCSTLDLELHLKNTNPIISFKDRNYQRRIFNSRYSFFGDADKKALIKKYARGIFESEDVDVCLSLLKNRTEQEKQAINDRENAIKAKQKEREQEKMKVIQEAEKQQKRRFAWMIISMVILVILSFVADYYICTAWLGYKSMWAYTPAVLFSVIGCVQIKEMFGYY